PVGELVFERNGWVAMQRHPLPLPGLRIIGAEHNQIAFNDLVAKLAEAHALTYCLFVGMIEAAEIAIAQHQSIVVAVKREALGAGLDRLGQPAAPGLALVGGGGKLIDKIG